MKVISLTSFVSRIDGKKYRADKDDVLDMPKGADWIKAGLVVKKGGAKKKSGSGAPESASLKAPEKAVKPAAKAKKASAKKKG